MIFLCLPRDKSVPAPAAATPRHAGLLGACLLEEKPKAPALAAAPGSGGLGPYPWVSDTSVLVRGQPNVSRALPEVALSRFSRRSRGVSVWVGATSVSLGPPEPAPDTGGGM